MAERDHTPIENATPDLSWRGRWPRYRRAAFLLLLAAGTLLILIVAEAWVNSTSLPEFCEHLRKGGFLYPLFFPTAQPEWKDRFNAVLLLLGIPIAWALWHWRDANVRDQIANTNQQVKNERQQIDNVRRQIENASKDISLREFQEVQLRAAGALDEKLPAEARDQLQIASLHQLRGFLRGEYGDSFRRPAFELLLAGHAAAMERIGHRQAIDSFVAGGANGGALADEIRRALPRFEQRMNPVDRERLNILRDEAKAIFGPDRLAPLLAAARASFPALEGATDDGGDADFSLGQIPEDAWWELTARVRREHPGPGFPLNHRRFDWIEMPNSTALAACDLSECSFIGANLRGARLDGANLSKARLDGADLGWAQLKRADLSRARLFGGNLSLALLDNAKLLGVLLDGADLTFARLLSADLGGSLLNGTTMHGARLDGANLFRALLLSVDLSNARLDAANLIEVWMDDQTNLDGAIITPDTHFTWHWRRLTEAERDEHRQPWLERGAILCEDSAAAAAAWNPFKWQPNP